VEKSQVKMQGRRMALSGRKSQNRKASAQSSRGSLKEAARGHVCLWGGGREQVSPQNDTGSQK